jgi:hypothetical protein
MRTFLVAAVVLLYGTVAATPGRAAVTEDNFLLRNAGDLVAVCSTPQSDPLYTAAVNFCHGFGLGVFRVLQADEVARRPPHMFCLPSQLPTRNEAIANYIQWVNANPSRAPLAAADSIAAYLAQTYPCPRGR